MGAASCGARPCTDTTCGVEGGTVLNDHHPSGYNMRHDIQKEKLIVFIKIRKKSNGKESMAPELLEKVHCWYGTTPQ
jgi:hypothetical protein